MTSDLLGGLGGLVKGLSGLMPQDDPATKVLTAAAEVEELKKQETGLLAEIGRNVIQRHGIDSYGELGNKLKLVQSNLRAAEEELNATKARQVAAEKEEAEEEAKRRCPNCGTLNAQGLRFCQECGTQLGQTKVFCVNCGAENAAGTRFCGECGAKMGE